MKIFKKSSIHAVGAYTQENLNEKNAKLLYKFNQAQEKVIKWRERERERERETKLGVRKCYFCYKAENKE